MSEQNNQINTESNPQKIVTNEIIQVDSEIDNNENIEIEASYRKALRLMNSISCMTLNPSKVEIYKRVANQFSEMPGFQDADLYAAECNLLAKQTASGIKKKAYKNANKKKERAKKATDYITVAEEFRKLGTYKNSAELCAECSQLVTHFEKKSSRINIFKYGVIIICLITIIFLSNTSHAKYYYANLCEMTGAYPAATKMYYKLGAYKDCPQKLKEATYQYAQSAAKHDNYVTAKKEYESVGDYKDSVDQVVEMEKQILRTSKIGDKVQIGDSKWYMIATKDKKALLLKSAIIKDIAYNDIYGNVTWENASLRKWLNSDFMDKNFSNAEKKQIVLTDIVTSNNASYATVGGNATQDYLFLLSEEEVAQYKEQLPKTKRNCWLRTPGNSQATAAFLTMNGDIMNYGYDVTSNQIGVYPLMWFDYK